MSEYPMDGSCVPIVAQLWRHSRGPTKGKRQHVFLRLLLPRIALQRGKPSLQTQFATWNNEAYHWLFTLSRYPHLDRFPPYVDEPIRRVHLLPSCTRFHVFLWAETIYIVTLTQFPSHELSLFIFVASAPTLIRQVSPSVLQAFPASQLRIHCQKELTKAFEAV